MSFRKLALVGMLLIGVSGCALKPVLSSVKPSFQPWVKPYERALLADPMMSFSRDPLADRHRQHVFEVREGARGAGQAQGGGCGCN